MGKVIFMFTSDMKEYAAQLKNENGNIVQSCESGFNILDVNSVDMQRLNISSVQINCRNKYDEVIAMDTIHNLNTGDTLVFEQIEDIMSYGIYNFKIKNGGV